MTNPYGSNPYQQYPQQSGPTPYPQQTYQGFPAPPSNNGLAIASMCVSLGALTTCYVGLVVGPVGAILGHVALRQIDREPQRFTGRGMALAGIIIGWIQCAAWLIFGTIVAIAIINAPAS